MLLIYTLLIAALFGGSLHLLLNVTTEKEKSYE